MKSIFDDIFKAGNNLTIRFNDTLELIDYFNHKIGWVYIAKNNNSDFLKIGRTKKNPIDRAKTLSTAGVIDDYEILYSVKSMNASRLESEVHKGLKNQRVKKEFFAINLNDAIIALEDKKKEEINLLSKFFNTEILYESVDLLEMAIKKTNSFKRNQ